MDGIPEISVIVPAYNVEGWISECIQSVLDQTFSGFELLVIDDGSTDKTGEICEEFAEKDNRVKVFHFPNSGASASRNRGLERAKGRYIVFVDGDDYYLEKESLEKLYNTAERYNLDIVRGDYLAVTGDGSPDPYQSCKPKEERYHELILNKEDFLEKIVQEEFFIWLLLIRRSSIKNVRFPENQKFLEDMAFLMLLCQQELKCMYLPLRFYAYRKLKSSASNVHDVRNALDAFGMCDFFNNIEKDSSSKRFRDFCRYQSVMMFYWTLSSLPYNYNDIEINQICVRSELKSLLKRTRRRVLIWRVFNKSVLLISPPLYMSMKLLRWRKNLG
ncbi:MAG: glycosyltransferase [Odoribacter sp.]|nr:glycosyltransferase [Odoribacter sp.]